MKKTFKKLTAIICGVMIVGSVLVADAKNPAFYIKDGDGNSMAKCSLSVSKSKYTASTQCCGAYSGFEANVSVLVLDKDGMLLSGATTMNNGQNWVTATTGKVTASKVKSYRTRHWVRNAQGNIVGDTNYKDYTDLYY